MRALNKELSYLSFIQIKLGLFVAINHLPKDAITLVNQMSKATYEYKSELFSKFPVKYFPNGDEHLYL